MDPHDTEGSPEDPRDTEGTSGHPATPAERDDAVTTGPGSPSAPPPGSPSAPGTPGAAWTPPDAGAATAPLAERDGIDIEVEDADGPPVPPPVRRRRRRRRALLAGAVLVVVGVPVGFAVTTTIGDEGTTSALGDDDDHADGDADEGADDGGGVDPRDGDGSADTGGDGGGPDDEALDPLDLDALSGTDAVYGRLLVDIDASERVMISFQDELVTIFRSSESPDAAIEALQDIGAASRDDLLEVRARLDDALDVDGAEEVRDRYVAHLDSWADYMDAVSEDPRVLDGEGAGVGFTVVINATADAFARTLEDELPDTVDASVRAYASDLLDRGFRSSGDSQV